MSTEIVSTKQAVMTNVNVDTTMQDIAGQIAATSARVYGLDVKHFAEWMQAQGLTPTQLTRSDMIAYRSHLASSYSKSAASRMLSVARRLLQEQVYNGTLASNPCKDVKGFTVANETTHIALTREQARELLSIPDQSTQKGKRDYTLLLLLLKTGIRRSECASLCVGDITMQDGHHIAIIRHGKGDKRRIVKLSVEVKRALQEYLEFSGRKEAAPDAPLFVQVNKGGRVLQAAISDKVVERVVKQYAQTIGVNMTPHGARSTFITIALESGAPLHKVQYAAGHADPRTTERYQKRKLNLDDNATDYVRF